MASVEIDLGRLGARGIVTDIEPYELGVEAVVSALNCVIRDGVPTAIAKLPVHTSGYSEAAVRVGGVIQHEGTTGRPIDHHRRYAGTLKRDTTSNVSEELDGADDYLPLVEHDGEGLWFCQDGLSSIVRWAGSGTTIVSGTYATTEDNAIITKTAGTVVNDQQYVSVRNRDAGIETTPYSVRVLENLSSTEFLLEADMSDTETGRTIKGRSHGVLGLSAPLHAFDGSPSVDINNNYHFVETSETEFPTTAPAFRDGDFIAETGGGSQVAELKDGTNFTPIIGVAVGYDSVIALTPSGVRKYQIMRSMPGTCGALHRGRLYTAGVSWMKNAVFIFPPGYQFHERFNGIDSPVTEVAEARMCKFLNVPDDNSEGTTVALLTTPSYLLVVRSNGIYGLSGEYPTNSVNLLMPSDGGVDVRGCVQTRYGQLICGYEGIYLHDRGGWSDLTKGTRKREWAARIRAIVNTTGSDYHRVCAVNAGRHILIVTARLSYGGVLETSECWGYDMEARTWCGDIPNLEAAMFSFNGAQKTSATGAPRAITWAHPELGYTQYNIAGFDHDGTTAVEPGLEVETGALAGLGDNERLVNMKLTYELTKDIGASPGIRVQTSNDGTSWGTTDTFSDASDGGAPVTVRTTRAFTATSHTGRMGRSGNNVRVKITDTSTGTIEQIKIHGARAIIRKRMRRGA